MDEYEQKKRESKSEMMHKQKKIQDVITYMLYIVFILNTFITGFGLAWVVCYLSSIDPQWYVIWVV